MSRPSGEQPTAGGCSGSVVAPICHASCAAWQADSKRAHSNSWVRGLASGKPSACLPQACRLAVGDVLCRYYVLVAGIIAPVLAFANAYGAGVSLLLLLLLLLSLHWIRAACSFEGEAAELPARATAATSNRIKQHMPDPAHTASLILLTPLSCCLSTHLPLPGS